MILVNFGFVQALNLVTTGSDGKLTFHVNEIYIWYASCMSTGIKVDIYWVVMPGPIQYLGDDEMAFSPDRFNNCPITSLRWPTTRTNNQPDNLVALDLCIHIRTMVGS